MKTIHLKTKYTAKIWVVWKGFGFLSVEKPTGSTFLAFWDLKDAERCAKKIRAKVLGCTITLPFLPKKKTKKSK